MSKIAQRISLEHRWQTQGPRAESRPPPCFIQPGTLFLPSGNANLLSPIWSSYIYTVLKLHSDLCRQPQGWWGPRWKWVWHPWPRGIPFLPPLAKPIMISAIPHLIFLKCSGISLLHISKAFATNWFTLNCGKSRVYDTILVAKKKTMFDLLGKGLYYFYLNKPKQN